MGKDVVEASGSRGFEDGQEPGRARARVGRAPARRAARAALARRPASKRVVADVFPAYDDDGGLLVAPPPALAAELARATSLLRRRLDAARRAEVGEHALLAARAARVADAPAVPDQQVREAAPVRARHELDQVALDLDRILLPRQPEALREPAHVRVDDDPLRVPELGRDDVRGLARDARAGAAAPRSCAAPAPSNSSSSTRIVPRSDFAFWRKKPVA